jgi:glycosyltransferase involved in cell wall biosynthesis
VTAAGPPRPEFSVVLPTRGDSPHLRAALRSALDCTGELEILLVHDRREGEASLPRELTADARVLLLESQPPGPAAARNLGIERARGRLIALLDDDDLWLADHLRSAAAALAAHPSATLLACDALLLDDRSEEGTGAVPAEPRELPRFLGWAAPRDVGLAELLRGNPILTPTVVLVRERLRPQDRFRVDLEVMEDYELWLRLARQGSLRLDSRATVVVRKRPGSASRDLRGMAERSLEILEPYAAAAPGDATLSLRQWRERLGALWHDLAYARLLEGDAAGCRAAAVEALRRLPLGIKNYMYWVVSILPGPLRLAIVAGGRRRRGSRAPRSPAGGHGAP